MNSEECIFSNGHYYAAYIYPAANSSPDVPTILLLHGFMGSAHVFKPLISFLREEYHIIALDLLGHGKTTGTDDPQQYNVDRQVEDLYNIVTHFHTHQTDQFFIYGYSMGGRLAMRFTITYPELVSHLILESADPGIKSKEDRINRYELDKERADKIITDFGTFLSEWEKAPIFQNSANTASENEQEAYRQIQKSQKPSCMAACLKGFSPGYQLPVYEELKNVRRPITLIAGENDEKYSQLYRQLDRIIVQSNRYIVSDAAHRVHLDKPQRIAEILKSSKYY